MRPFIPRCLLIAIATPVLLQAAPPEGPSRLFEGHDLFALEWAAIGWSRAELPVRHPWNPQKGHGNFQSSE